MSIKNIKFILFLNFDNNYYYYIIYLSLQHNFPYLHYNVYKIQKNCKQLLKKFWNNIKII